MPETHPDPARARRLAVGVLVALAVLAAVVVVLAVATGSYLLLTGLVAIAAGGAVALVLLRSEEILDDHEQH